MSTTKIVTAPTIICQIVQQLATLIQWIPMNVEHLSQQTKLTHKTVSDTTPSPCPTPIYIETSIYVDKMEYVLLPFRQKLKILWFILLFYLFKFVNKNPKQMFV